jgi:hypothetical protein
MDWQASSIPPPQPPAELKAQPIFPSIFIQCSPIVSSQNLFIFQERIPMLVGLPTARPSHQITSWAVASSRLRRRASVSGMIEAPSATNRAIKAVFPLLESNRTRMRFMAAECSGLPSDGKGAICLGGSWSPAELAPASRGLRTSSRRTT